MFFINGDLDHDFYAEKGSVYIIDWHTACYGDPAWDLARFCCAYEAQAPRFIKAYLAGNRDAQIIARVRIFIYLNSLLLIAGSLFVPPASDISVLKNKLARYLADLGKSQLF